MAIPNAPVPVLSDDLHAIIGFAIVDRSFQELLLTNPRSALAGFDLSPRDRKAAVAIHGAASLAEYAVRLEQRLTSIDSRGRMALPTEKREDEGRVRAAS